MMPPNCVTPFRLALPLLLCSCASVLAAPVDQVNQARREGWGYAAITVGLIRGADNSELPGTRAWLADYEGVEKTVNATNATAPLPPIDAGQLVTHNANFWRMVYEITPGDPALALLHGGLLLAGGEAARASDIGVFARQRPGLDEIMEQALSSLVVSAMSAQKPSHDLVEAGIKLHDAGDLAGALRKYDEALAVLPADGWAHYERGFTLHAQALQAAGQKVPASDTVALGQPIELAPEVRKEYAAGREHDPLRLQAWQGNEAAVVRGARALVVKAQPVWDEIRRDVSTPVSDEQLGDLTDACRTARIDEYALALRQIVIARRRQYDGSDHPFISDCLRRLAPGQTTDVTLRKLAVGAFSARQLAPIAPGFEMHAAPASPK
jgi:hypothetical protein